MRSQRRSTHRPYRFPRLRRTGCGKGGAYRHHRGRSQAATAVKDDCREPSAAQGLLSLHAIIDCHFTGGHTLPSPNDKKRGNGLSDQAYETLRAKLVDLAEPLSDAQLLGLADGLHDLLRQRRTVRQHHVERMVQRRHVLDMRI